MDNTFIVVKNKSDINIWRIMLSNKISMKDLNVVKNKFDINILKVTVGQ